MQQILGTSQTLIGILLKPMMIISLDNAMKDVLMQLSILTNLAVLLSQFNQPMIRYLWLSPTLTMHRSTLLRWFHQLANLMLPLLMVPISQEICDNNQILEYKFLNILKTQIS